MEYFKDSKNNVFAYDDSDIAHDKSVSERIEKLEADGASAESIASVRSKIRIDDDLIQITESEKDELLKPSNEQLAIQHAMSEHAWVKSELDNVQVQLMYHWTSDHRASHTEQSWKEYAIALRNYTTTDAEGNPQVVGESRPNIDSYL